MSSASKRNSVESTLFGIIIYNVSYKEEASSFNIDSKTGALLPTSRAAPVGGEGSGPTGAASQLFCGFHGLLHSFKKLIKKC